MNASVRHSAIATAVPTKLPTISSSGKDPTFRAIDRLRAAHEAIDNSLKRNGGNVGKREDDRYASAINGLLATQPSTRAGLLALLRYARESKDVRGYLDGGAAPIMRLLQSIEASCARLIPAQPLPTWLHSDAKLIAMGDELKKLFMEWMIAKPDANGKWLKANRIAGKRPADIDPRAYAKKFSRACKQTGYTTATNHCDKLIKEISRLAKKMLKSPAHTVEGRALQTAAALTFDDTFEFHICDGEECGPSQRALWGIALTAGFAVPVWFRKWARPGCANLRTL
jgi:hypothetical protein